MKQAVFITLLMGLMLILAAPLAGADYPPIAITPYPDGIAYCVAEGQEVVIRAGWVACKRGLAEAFRHNALIAMEIDSESGYSVSVEPPSREYWSKPQIFEPPPTAINRYVLNTNDPWVTEWFYSLGELPLGEYTGHFLLTLAHPLPDGGDYDGDGRIDIFTSGGNSDRFTPFGIDSNFKLYIEETCMP